VPKIHLRITYSEKFGWGVGAREKKYQDSNGYHNNEDENIGGNARNGVSPNWKIRSLGWSPTHFKIISLIM